MIRATEKFVGTPPRDRRLARLHVQRADAERSGLPRQTTTTANEHRPAVLEPDTPAEKENRRAAAEPTAGEETRAGVPPGTPAEVEDPLPLKEELALLRKKEAKARQVDLLLVNLHLREIRVVGEVGRQAVRDSELRLDAEVAAAAVRERRIRVQVGRQIRNRVRLDLEPGS